jgi:diguanylate cyclase (GGDEF)-like protein
LGGEEFALVLPGADIATAKAQVAQLQAALAGTPGPAPVTLSAGIAALQAGDTLASWLERADRQLYAAKAAGRACVRAEGTP